MNLLVYILVGIFEIIIIGSHFASGISKKTQHEADIRLPYKKYRELYPTTTFKYEQYKQMQGREAFNASIPSKKLIRMVR